MLERPVSRWLSLVLILSALVAGFLIFYLPRQLEIFKLKEAYPEAMKELKNSYEDFLLQSKNLEKLKGALKFKMSYEDFIKALPKELSYKRDKNVVEVSGRLDRTSLSKLLKIALETSNLRFKELVVDNKMAIPVIVFPLKSSPVVDVHAKIEILEVRR